MRVGVHGGHSGSGRISLIIVFVVFVCVAAGLFVARASPIFKLRATDAAAQQVRRVVADAASRIITKYDADLLEKTLANNGEISMISINSIQLNEIRSEFTKELITQLSDTTRTTVLISLGSLMKNEVFQGIGPRIPVKIAFGSVSDIDFYDEFTSVGINQTKHVLGMKVSVSTSVISAFMHDTREIETTLPLCENIIIGKVPQYYSDRLNVAAKGELTNEQGANKTAY